MVVGVIYCLDSQVFNFANLYTHVTRTLFLQANLGYPVAPLILLLHLSLPANLAYS